MNYILSLIKSVWFQFLLALLANIISWLVIFIQIKPSGEEIPLHYGIFYGTDLVGKGYYLYLIPLAGLAILGLNYFFYTYTRYKEPIAGRALVVVALLVQFFLLLALMFLKSIIVI